jgi:hypothetical protein
LSRLLRLVAELLWNGVPSTAYDFISSPIALTSSAPFASSLRRASDDALRKETRYTLWKEGVAMNVLVPPDHLLLDSAPNLGPLISSWEVNKFENCWYRSVRILEVLKRLFQQFLNLSSSQRYMSGPILRDLYNNRWSGVDYANRSQVQIILNFSDPNADDRWWFKTGVLIMRRKEQ